MVQAASSTISWMTAFLNFAESANLIQLILNLSSLDSTDSMNVRTIAKIDFVINGFAFLLSCSFLIIKSSSVSSDFISVVIRFIINIVVMTYDNFLQGTIIIWFL